MAVPPIVAATLAQALASDKAQDLAANLWTKLFQKDEIPVVAENPSAQLVDLIGNLPTNDELAAAFAALEARLAATATAEAAATRRLVVQIGIGLAVIQTVSLLVVLALRF